MDAPGTRTLLSHQWKGYAQFHRSRSNLMIHIVAVPVFLIANMLFVLALFHGNWIVCAAAAVTTMGSLMVQGRGHHDEPKPAEPFTSTLNAIARIFAEQWLTFPRFVLTGGWSRTLRELRTAEQAR